VQLVPYTRRRDWWLIPEEWAPEISPAPGLQLYGSKIGVHRSHLPLLVRQHPEAAQALVLPPPNLALRIARDQKTEPSGFRLRGYQHEGVEFINNRRGTLLADQMRMGKTLTAVAAHDPDRGPLLVVGPLAAREVWARWMRLCHPGREPIIVKGRNYQPDQLRDADCVFIHYDILPFWQNFGLRRIGTLVFDEAHLLSNKQTKRTKAAQLLAYHSEVVIAATGTPLWNRPGGMWGILSCLNPGGWGSLYDFSQRYSDPQLTPYGTKYNGASNVEEFRARIAEVMIRRTWQDVHDDLPPIERCTEVADVTEKQLFQVELLAEKARDVTKRATQAGNLARFRRLLGQLKVPLAVDVAIRVLDSGEPVVIWTWHRAVAQSIASAIGKHYPAFCSTGEDTVDKREDTIAAWRAAPVAALVLTISVGQVAIDLSHARHAIFAEVDFTPTTVAQAEMRTFSPVQPMTVTYLIVDHSIDRRIVAALQEKCATGEQLGVPAAESAIDVIAQAFDLDPKKADMQRLMDSFLAGPQEGI
jgi:SWI/SNF-related matrix-associated actin-dependent regulator 1 of chromatin subfamily A